MTSAAPEPKKPNYQLKAGEINLDLIPPHWALTPLRDKRAYIAGWTHQPYSIDQIKREFDEGRATGVGLMSGQWSNEGGLVWVDIDGPAAIPELEKIAGAPLSAIFPPTLTISSGKPDRKRMLYSVPSQKLSLLPEKAKNYIYALEDFIGAKISSISTSPEREDTILIEDPFKS